MLFGAPEKWAIFKPCVGTNFPARVQLTTRDRYLKVSTVEEEENNEN